MRTSRYLLSTLKEAPSEAELASHRLMLRAGFIRRLASGIYTWMPIGLLPVVPSTVDSPVGVILLTGLSPMFDV